MVDLLLQSYRTINSLFRFEKQSRVINQLLDIRNWSRAVLKIVCFCVAFIIMCYFDFMTVVSPVKF